jgi:pimeloyl-ACP methyl ester carboxylesterase
VLVDVRGTGRSNPLRCELGGSDKDIPGYFNDFLPIDRVAACKQTLAARADLTQYTTRAAVDDLEEVRKKLGYQTINLYGSSYGTRLAQEFMRHHPDSVRMAILDGVASPSLIAPATYARDAQRSLEGVFALCAADAACSEAYPELRADYEAMLARIAYSPEMYALVPSIMHRAARGDFEQFGQTALDHGRAIRGLDFGLFLSVTCAEDIARLDILAVYDIAVDTDEMVTTPSAPDEFRQLLSRRHAFLMHDRPDKRPGQWKEKPNQAGNIIFAAPETVNGTLTQGLAWTIHESS